MTVSLNFDSNGGMATPTASGCAASLSQDPGGNYTLIVYAN